MNSIKFQSEMHFILKFFNLVACSFLLEKHSCKIKKSGVYTVLKSVEFTKSLLKINMPKGIFSVIYHETDLSFFPPYSVKHSCHRKTVC